MMPFLNLQSVTLTKNLDATALTQRFFLGISQWAKLEQNVKISTSTIFSHAHSDLCTFDI